MEQKQIDDLRQRMLYIWGGTFHSQGTLCAEIGISRVTLWRFIGNKTKLTVSTLSRIYKWVKDQEKLKGINENNKETNIT